MSWTLPQPPKSPFCFYPGCHLPKSNCVTPLGKDSPQLPTQGRSQVPPGHLTCSSPTCPFLLPLCLHLPTPCPIPTGPAHTGTLPLQGLGTCLSFADSHTDLFPPLLWVFSQKSPFQSVKHSLITPLKTARPLPHTLSLHPAVFLHALSMT